MLPQTETFTTEALDRFLRRRFGEDAALVGVEPLGTGEEEKGRGYGAPLLLHLASGQRLVLHRALAGGFGREDLADRAHATILSYETFNELPGHVPALGLGAILDGGRLVSLGGVEAFFFLTEYAEGTLYARDLEEAAGREVPAPRDLARVRALADALAGLHRVRRDEPERYRRRVRELMGDSECISGMLDTYDDVNLEGWSSSDQLLAIERRCVDWRLRLKGFSHRLRRVHGDFHPWNLLFDGERLILLDRSRGPYGEPADDVAALAVNYLFFSLRAHGRVKRALRTMWFEFFDRYLEATNDHEILQTLPPFLTWRALVLASPAWYPHISPSIRKKLLHLAERVLDRPAFDPAGIDTLLATH